MHQGQLFQALACSLLPASWHNVWATGGTKCKISELCAYMLIISKPPVVSNPDASSMQPLCHKFKAAVAGCSKSSLHANGESA